MSSRQIGLSNLIDFHQQSHNIVLFYIFIYGFVMFSQHVDDQKIFD